MKANEIEDGKVLMIGDFVIGCIETDVVGEATYKIPCKVTGINHYKDVICEPLKSFPDELDWQEGDDFSWIEPIPLTAEILEKNGFEEIKWDEFGDESSEGNPTNIFRCELETKCLMIKVEVDIYRPNFIIISAPDDCGGEVEISNISKIDGSDIMLHELQHAFRLCGITHEIVL